MVRVDRMRQKRFNTKGFTLVEVLVAMVILLIGMLGIMGMQYSSVSGNAFSREMRIATTLGQELVEMMKSTPYSTIAAWPGDTQYPLFDSPPKGSAISGGIQFTRNMWVVPNCIALQITNDDNTCNATLAAQCNTTVANVAAIWIRTCWTDKNDPNVIHSVTIPTTRWDESAVP